MSNHTYVCERCGNLRRRPVVYLGRDGAQTTDPPLCHDVPMQVLRKGYAEAATKLQPEDRVRWLSMGGHVIRKAGRHWVAALTEREITIAREQLARYRGEHAPAI